MPESLTYAGPRLFPAAAQVEHYCCQLARLRAAAGRIQSPPCLQQTSVGNVSQLLYDLAHHMLAEPAAEDAGARLYSSKTRDGLVDSIVVASSNLC